MKKMIQLLLAVLMLVQVLIPTTAFASEIEVDDVYGDSVEVEMEGIEEEDSWTDEELAEWDTLLADNDEVRDQSVDLFQLTQGNEAAAELQMRHLELYHDANDLREEDVLDLDFARAKEALVENTDGFETLVGRFKALMAVPEVEVPEVDAVVPEVTPDVEGVPGEVVEDEEVVVTPESTFTVTTVGSSNDSMLTSFTAPTGTVVRVWADIHVPFGRTVNWQSNVTGVAFTVNHTNHSATFMMPSSDVTITATLVPLPPPPPPVVRRRINVTANLRHGANLLMREYDEYDGYGDSFLTSHADFVVGSTVSLRASSPMQGYRFVRWEGPAGVVFANRTHRNTTFRVPAGTGTITVRAVYERRVARNPRRNRRQRMYLRNNTSFRRGPGSRYHLINSQARGRRVTILNNGRNGWRFVQVGSRRGWIRRNQLITPAAQRARVERERRAAERANQRRTRSTVFLRQRPNAAARNNLVGGSLRSSQVNANTSVTIVERRTIGLVRWVRIRAGNRTGWTLEISLR